MSSILTIATSTASAQNIVILQDGALVDGPNPITAVGNFAPRVFSYDIAPLNLAAGRYQFVCYRQTGNQDIIRAVGEFYFDGTDILSEEDQAALLLAGIQQSEAVVTSTVSTEVGSLNDLSSAEVFTELQSYGVAQVTDLAAQGATILAGVNQGFDALNDLNETDILDALQNYGVASTTDVTDALAEILAGQGLTAAQQATLTFIRNVLEADENLSITDGVGTAQKLLKGTSTVLVSKDVNTTAGCDTTTTLTE